MPRAEEEGSYAGRPDLGAIRVYYIELYTFNTHGLCEHVNNDTCEDVVYRVCGRGNGDYNLNVGPKDAVNGEIGGMV